MSRFNIFNRNWLDTVFEGRNKSYGAYKMRKDQNGIMFKAFVIGTTIFGILISVPMISKALTKDNIGSEGPVILVEASDLFLESKKDEKKDEVIPPKVEKKVKPKKTVMRYTVPKPAPEEEAEEILTQKELENVDIGRETVIGDEEDGDIIIDEKVAPKSIDVDIDVTEGDKIYTMTSIGVKPEPKGGLKAFYSYISENFRVPDIISNTTLKIYVSFVVDKDGTLTDIKVLRDMGYGTGDEAIRILKKYPKWNPGIQNGTPVKVSYQLPILIKIN